MAATAGHRCAICATVDVFATEENTFVDIHVAERVLRTAGKLRQRYIRFDLHLHYYLIVKARNRCHGLLKLDAPLLSADGADTQLHAGSFS